MCIYMTLLHCAPCYWSSINKHFNRLTDIGCVSEGRLHASHSFSYTLWQAWRGTLVVKGYYIRVRRERSITRRGDEEQRGSQNGRGTVPLQYLNVNTKWYACFWKLTLTNCSSCDRSLLPPLSYFVLMSYPSLKLEIWCFLSFSIVRFRCIIEIWIKIIILSYLTEEFAQKSI